MKTDHIFFYPDNRSEFVALRHKLGLSQPAAGEALGRSAAWIRKLEQGGLVCPPYAVYAMRYLCEHASKPGVDAVG